MKGGGAVGARFGGWLRRLFCLALALLLGAALAFFAGAPERAARREPPGLRAAFAEAAFRAEYDEPGRDTLRRWAARIRLFAQGAYTPQDLLTLETFVGELNAKVKGLPEVSLARSAEEANVLLSFAPLSDLPALLSGYVAGNWGFFMFWTDARQEMTRARVLIASDVTSQQERSHLLLEELTGLLGLPNDLEGHPDSIIHQRWTTTQALSELDWQLLNLVYDARLRPGMGWQEAQQALGWD